MLPIVADVLTFWGMKTWQNQCKETVVVPLPNKTLKIKYIKTGCKKFSWSRLNDNTGVSLEKLQYKKRKIWIFKFLHSTTNLW